MKGTIYNEEFAEETPFEQIVSGDSRLIDTQIAGIEMKIAYKNGKWYVISEQYGTYTVVTREALKAAQLFTDEDIDELVDVSFESGEPISFEDLTWGRKELDCWTKYDDDGWIHEFYVKDGSVAAFIEYDAAGYLYSAVRFERFTADVYETDFEFEKDYRRVPLMTMFLTISLGEI